MEIGNQVRVIAESSAHYKCVGKIFEISKGASAVLVDFEPEKPAGEVAPVFFMTYEVELVK